MPWASEQNAGFFNPQAVGPVLLTVPYPLTAPTSIASGTPWTSGLLAGDGYKLISVGLTSTAAGEISVQRYIDNMLGQTPQGAAVTQAIAANTPAILNITDGLPFGCYEVTITTTSGTGTISGFAILMAAA